MPNECRDIWSARFGFRFGVMQRGLGGTGGARPGGGGGGGGVKTFAGMIYLSLTGKLQRHNSNVTHPPIIHQSGTVP